MQWHSILTQTILSDLKTCSKWHKNIYLTHRLGIVKTSELYDHIIRVKKWMKANARVCRICVKGSRGWAMKSSMEEIHVCKKIFLKHLKHTKCVPRLVQHFTHCGKNLCVDGFKLQTLWQNAHQIFWSTEAKKFWFVFNSIKSSISLYLHWRIEQRGGSRLKKQYTCILVVDFLYCLVVVFFRPLSHFIVFMYVHNTPPTDY